MPVVQLEMMCRTCSYNPLIFTRFLPAISVSEDCHHFKDDLAYLSYRYVTFMYLIKSGLFLIADLTVQTGVC